MKNNILLWSFGVILTVGLSIGGFWLFQKNRKMETPKVQDNFEKTLQSLKSQAANPEQNLFSQKDFAKFRAKLMNPTNESERQQTLQAGIVYFDSTTQKWVAGEAEKAYQIVDELLKSNLHGQDQKKSMVLAVNLSKRIVSQAESPVISKLVETKLHSLSDDPYEKNLYYDIASLVRPLPPSFRQKVHKCIWGKDLGLAQSCLSISEQILDQDRKQEIMIDLAKTHKDLDPKLRPFAARILLSEHRLFESEAQAILKEASGKNEETWQDVFLYGVVELGLQKSYLPRIEEIAKKSPSPIMQQKAQSILR
jgi:hypothetical protein